MNRVIAICGLMALAVSFSVAADRKFEKSFAVSSGGNLIVNTDVGSVKVVGTGGSAVVIIAELEGRQKDVDDFDITAEQKGNEIVVRGKSSRKKNWLFGWGSNDLDVRFTIEVPAAYSADLNTSGGDIVVSSLKGTVKGKTSGGDLEMKNVEGTLDMRTSGGNIRAEKVTGSLAMETSGGDVNITEARGSLDVGTSGGSISIAAIDGKIRAETSGGNIKVRMAEGHSGLHAETSGGNIDVQVPRSIAATIDASTSGGEVSCDLPITMSGKFSESRIRGTVNGGGELIKAHTSGGNVRIRALD